VLVPLSRADDACGAKALGLRRLLDAGFAVPDGLVITDPGQDGWDRDLGEALRRLGPGPYAVRSSAPGEDGADASFAGQLDSTLNAPREQVVAAVRRTARSAQSPAARAYVAALEQADFGPVPVIVQAMVHPEAAGVAFTRHPVTGGPRIVIEAVPGLGDRLMNGSVTPERWTVEGDVVDCKAAAEPAITAGQAMEVAEAARRIERLFARPQDVEWAIASGTTWILQARPITTTAHAMAVPRVDGEHLVTGTPASPGSATGPVRVVRGLDDFRRFAAGDVLVCRTTSPAWTPVLARAAAVVTETGGILAHAAIVARELGIPAVVAAPSAMTRLADGRTVVVDGRAGSVTAAPRIDRP
jgi:pyruvate,water dikinase